MSVQKFVAVSLLAAAGANATIVSVTGMGIQIGPPPAANPIALNGALAYAFNEQSGVFIPPLPVDMLNNPGNSGAPIGGIFSGIVDSHLIHFAPLQSPSFNAVGTVTFATPIIAVTWNSLFLDMSDPFAGAGPTVYPTGNPMRGMSFPSFLSINANVLSFNLWGTPGVADFEQIRVYTDRVPAPGSAALLAIAGALAARRRRTR